MRSASTPNGDAVAMGAWYVSGTGGGEKNDEAGGCMDVWVGTSGWSYDEWKGSFYPEDLPKDGMLEYYASRLRAVEVNNTFYRMPRKEVVRGWRDQTPEDFSFVLKASRRITHQAKLGDGAGDALDFLLESSAELGHKRGPILFQTPPWLKGDVGLLSAFLERIPAGVRAAFEFRSTSWFTDDVFQALSDAGVALVVADTGNPDKDPPLLKTAPYGYARLRREAYDGGLLEQWAEDLREVGWSDLWVFFKHEDEATGPRLAQQFSSLLSGVDGDR